jgi:hypothetical protein
MRSLVAAVVCFGLGGLAATGSMAQAPGQPAAAPTVQQQPQAGRPANLCQELVAYLRQPKPGAAAPANPALKTAVQAPTAGNQQPSQPSGQGAPTTAGIAGPIPTDSRQAGSGSPTAPAAPTAPSPAPSASPAANQSQVALEDAEALARGNDIAGCRAATQRLRMAGAPLPPALLALGALDLKYLEASAQPAE